MVSRKEKKRKETFSYKEKRKQADWGIDFYFEQYKNKIRKGHCYTRRVCNQLLYKRSVHIFVKSKYSCQNFFSVQSSFDGKQYVCKTCHLISDIFYQHLTATINRD